MTTAPAPRPISHLIVQSGRAITQCAVRCDPVGAVLGSSEPMPPRFMSTVPACWSAAATQAAETRMVVVPSE